MLLLVTACAHTELPHAARLSGEALAEMEAAQEAMDGARDALLLMPAADDAPAPLSQSLREAEDRLHAAGQALHRAHAQLDRAEERLQEASGRRLPDWYELHLARMREAHAHATESLTKLRSAHSRLHVFVSAAQPIAHSVDRILGFDTERVLGLLGEQDFAAARREVYRWQGEIGATRRELIVLERDFGVDASALLEALNLAEDASWLVRELIDAVQEGRHERLAELEREFGELARRADGPVDGVGADPLSEWHARQVRPALRAAEGAAARARAAREAAAAVLERHRCTERPGWPERWREWWQGCVPADALR